MKNNKYKYYNVLQMYVSGVGYEDVDQFETKSNYICNPVDKANIKHQKKEYSLMGYNTRVISRKELSNT